MAERRAGRSQVRVQARVSSRDATNEDIPIPSQRMAADAVHHAVRSQSYRRRGRWREGKNGEDGEESSRSSARVLEPDRGEDGGSGESKSIQEVVGNGSEHPGLILGSPGDVLLVN